jgi:hypothetical protein
MYAVSSPAAQQSHERAVLRASLTLLGSGPAPLFGHPAVRFVVPREPHGAPPHSVEWVPRSLTLRSRPSRLLDWHFAAAVAGELRVLAVFTDLDGGPTAEPRSPRAVCVHFRLVGGGYQPLTTLTHAIDDLATRFNKESP